MKASCQVRISVRAIVLLIILILVGGISQAQTTNHQIPYKGHLDLNGAPQSGDFDFIFEIRDSTDAVLWDEQFTGVKVVAGEFSVTLGQDAANNPLGDAIWQNDELYLAIQVKASIDALYTPLAGRQRILAVPYAARSQTAKDYRIMGNLHANSAVVDNGLTTDSLTVNNGATVHNGLWAGTRRVITDMCLCVTNSSTGGCGCCQDGASGWVEIGRWDIEGGGGSGRPCMECDLQGGSGSYMTSLCARY